MSTAVVEARRPIQDCHTAPPVPSRSPELLSAQYLRDHRTAAMHELNEAPRAFLARPIETVAWRKDGQLWFEDDCGFSLREVISQGFMLPQEPMRATLVRELRAHDQEQRPCLRH